MAVAQASRPIARPAAPPLSLSGRLLTLLPPVGVVVVLLAMPLALLVIYSLWAYKPGEITTRQWTFENYARFIRDPFYLRILLNTAVLGLVVTALSMVVGYPVAYVAARSSPGVRSLIMFLVVMPMMVGLVAKSFGWIVIFGTEGLVNQTLRAMGVISAPLRLLYTQLAVVVGLIQVELPFMILTLMAGIERVPRSVEEAARTLGASRWAAFRRVILPGSLPGLVAGSLLVFSGTITAYAVPALLGGASTKLMSTLIFQSMLVSYNWPFGAAIGVVLISFSSLAILLYLRALGAKAT